MNLRAVPPTFRWGSARGTVDDAVLHYEIHSGRGADVGDRVAGHSNNIGELARSQHAEIIAAEQFGGEAGGCLQAAYRAQPSVGLEFEDAVTEREHAAISTVSDLDLTV